MSTALSVGAGARTSPSDDLRTLRRQNALRLERLRSQRIERAERSERRRELKESLSLDWVTPYAELLNLARYNGDPLVSGPASVWHRNQGRNWPFYQTEAELSLLRAPARILFGSNGYAQGLVEGLLSYLIGPGCTFRMGKVSDRDQTEQAVIDAAQRIVDELLERNSWKGGAEESLEVEFFVNSIVDGEGILAHYFGEDGWTDYRCRDAQQLTMPPGADWREYSFGVMTPAYDSAKHLRYYLQHGDTPSEGEEYDPDEVTHLKRNVVRSMKRGIPDFSFDIYDALYLSGKLRANLADTATQQAAIVAIRQHDNAAQEDVQAFVEADSDFTQSDPLTSTQQQIKLRRRGGWEDVPKGQNYVPGPIATSSPIHLQVLDACARSAGQKWQAPAWLMSGDMNAMNYATSLTAESPFVKSILRNQGRYCEAFRRAIWLGFRHYVKTHGLRVPQEDGSYKTYSWEDVERLLKLSVTAPSPETRNKLEEAQRAQTEITLGVQSRQAYMQEQGRDPDKIEADNQEYQEKFGDGGRDLPLNPGDQPGPVQAPAPAPGADVPTVESEASEDALHALLESVADDLLEGGSREEGEVWKGQSGRWFTKKNGRVVPAKAPVAAKPGAKPAGKAAAKKEGPKPVAKPQAKKPAAKPDPKATAEAVKAQLAGDASKLTPKAVKDFEAKLATLTKPVIAALAKEHALKLGKTKADAIAALVSKAKELKKAADAKKRAEAKAVKLPEPKPVDPPPPKREVGEIDYRHKDANNPVVKALRENKTAEGALRAVLNSALDLDERIKAANAKSEAARAALDAHMNKKSKRAKDYWPKVNELLKARNDAEDASRKAVYEERQKTRAAALASLQAALKTGDMPGIEARQIANPLTNGVGGVHCRGTVQPLVGAPDEAKVLANVGESHNFVAGVLSNHKLRVVHARVEQGQRGHCGDFPGGYKLIAHDHGGNPQTGVHELGHAIEFQKLGATDAAKAFLDYRVGDEPLTSLKEKFGEGYDEGERGRKDDFEKVFGTGSQAYYAGKDYPHATEIVSMGLEKVFADPVDFARKDPEYFQFICHVLSM